eukprot:m.97849 g.97849  ORF g.97849 m.97849 type:complete len:407 (+) comp16729_c0_seq1:482-1702(+)
MKVSKRCLMDSSLSSERPEVCPRASRRVFIVSCEHSIHSISFFLTDAPTLSLNNVICSCARGNPSSNTPCPSGAASMALLITSTVMSSGTSLPSAWMAAICFPRSVPLCASVRSKSPTDKCSMSYLDEIFEHCVPFPLPGPPTTNTTLRRCATGTLCSSFSTAAHVDVNTSSISLSASIRCTCPKYLNASTTGLVFCTKVSKRFSIAASLSSDRPEVFPLLRRRCFITSREHSIHNIIFDFTEGEIFSSSRVICCSARGNPSSKIPFPAGALSIAFFKTSTVQLSGTSSPFACNSAILFPRSDPLAASARSKSPTEKCSMAYFSAIFAHCVPFPLPGPPTTKITFFLPINAKSASNFFCCSSDMVADMVADEADSEDFWRLPLLKIDPMTTNAEHVRSQKSSSGGW